MHRLTTPLPSLDAAIAQVASHQRGLLTAADTTALGITRDQRYWRVKTGRWTALYPGIYRIAGIPRSWHSDLLAACLAGDAYASHRSGAALRGLPGGSRDLIEVIAKRWERGQHGGLVVHESLELDDVDTTIVDGIPTTTIERTLFDLCRSSPTVVVDMATDRALSRGLTDLERLRAIEARLATRGRPGAARFHEVMARRSDGVPLPESGPERRLAHLLVGQGLPEPEIQHVIRDVDGRIVARCDLAYPQWRIVIEYDSIQEHTGRAALLRDSARRNAITALGYTPVIATVEDLRNKAVRLAADIVRIRDLRAN